MIYIVATPIGNPKDISERALEAIKQSDLIIGEERKVTTKLLKQYGLTGRPVELLNEHSDSEDLNYLLEQCKEKTVALVSDCGTPGFCDPGAYLVKLCRDNGIKVIPVPGASSLMAFLSVCGYRLDEFLFRGFLPANTEKRKDSYKKLTKESRPFIIMDTPYRLEKTLTEVSEYFSSATCVIGYRITFEDEQVIEGTAQQLLQKLKGQKGEFIMLVLNK